MGGNEPSNEIRLPDDLPNLHDNELSIKLSDDNKLKKVVLEKESVKEVEKLLFKKHNGYIFFKNLWIFRFFNSSCDEIKLDEFSELLKSKGYDVSSTDKIIDIIVNKKRGKN